MRSRRAELLANRECGYGNFRVLQLPSASMQGIDKVPHFEEALPVPFAETFEAATQIRNFFRLLPGRGRGGTPRIC